MLVGRDAAAAVDPRRFRRPRSGRAGRDQVRAADRNHERHRPPAKPHCSPTRWKCRRTPRRSSVPAPPSSWKYGSRMLGSTGVHPHEQPIVVGSGLCVVMALMIAVSVDPTYTTRLASPGAMPSACVMSSVCSVSSQNPAALESTQAVLSPVRGEQGDRHVVGLTDVLVIRVQVGQICAHILQQTQVLARAVERRPAVVGRAHVAAQEGSRRPGAGRGVRHYRGRGIPCAAA